MSEEEPDEENVPPIMNHVPSAKQPVNVPGAVELPVFNGPVVVPRSSAAAISTVPIHPVSDARCLGKNYNIPVHKNAMSIPQNVVSVYKKWLPVLVCCICVFIQIAHMIIGKY